MGTSCAIVGGYVAQEIIKSISANESPLKNYFFYDVISGNNQIESIGA